MSVQSFIPEIWSAQLQSSLKKSLVFANLANRRYEGEIKQAGDTVHITSVNRPTISTYLPNVTTITPETLSTADRTLVVSQAQYFAFGVDDVDARQIKGNVMDEAAKEAAYGLSDQFDQFVAGKYTDIVTANKVNAGVAVSILTGDVAYTQLTKLRQKLDEANVPTMARWAIIPPWMYALLLDSNRIAANPAATGNFSEQAIVQGFIGRIAGFDLYESNNTPVVAANQSAVIGGTSDAWTVAEQIDQVEAYRAQAAFEDVVRGLHLYGAKVTRPDGMALLVASSV